MSTFISTINFTEQGMREFKDTCQRAENFKKHAKKMGIKVNEIYWTQGPFDGLLVFDAPDDTTATALMAHVCAGGFVHTQTTRAYRADEMKAILEKV